MTWQAESDPDILQSAYEIQAASTAEFRNVMSTSGVVEGAEQVAVSAPGGPLRSREVRFYRVRVFAGNAASQWSPALPIEAGLLRPEDWAPSSAITLPDDPGRERQSPSPILRRAFDLAYAPVRARLHVTSLGLHEIRINGHRVGDHLLSPGWTSYRKRLLADTHDVTHLLRPGANAIGAILADGWYRGRLGWDPEQDRCRYGSELGLILRLEAELPDGSVAAVVSDGDWRASTAEVRAADLYDGAIIDLRELRQGWDQPDHDDRAWHRAAVVPFDPAIIEPRSAPPVRAVATLPLELRRRSDGTIRLDSGQNLAGFVRLRVRGRAGDRVMVRHAEVLDADDSLHTRSLRSARATDEYTLADDAETVLEPRFTLHGFRYADVATAAEVIGAEVVAISSDLMPRGSFDSSNADLNQLVRNVRWSQLSNFVSLPTDCPQRDERLGWTGDAQAFAPTASTLFDARAFWLSWLRDLELDQVDELGVPSVVPDVVLEGVARFGRAGWADAATIVPWAVYESTGDVEAVRRPFTSMRRWVDSLVSRTGLDGLLEPSWQFGDWLDPDAPPDRPSEAKAKGDFLANAFFAHSTRLVAEAAELLGEGATAARYREIGASVARATWERWSHEAQTTQTGCAVALRFDLVPTAVRPGVVDALARLVNDADGRVATGFLGTPLVLPALADAGRFEEAYRMLLRTESPSWLYQVSQGATTVWERWDAIRPDGSIHPGTLSGGPDEPDDGQMLSFNHYAYGAVVDWIFRHVAGVAPVRDRPGYRAVRFAPRPVAGMSWARAAVESAYGQVAILWRVEGDELTADLELPSGTTGVFVAPATEDSAVVVDGRLSAAGSSTDVGPGAHRITVTRPAIVDLASRSPVA